ncbi:GTP-binding protein RHO3 [Fusarium coicis]|nr:GTP-binding protein RHO3 [Fusarium coicis]
MGLFGRREPSPEPIREEPPRKHGLFSSSSRHEPTSTRTSTSSHHRHSRGSASSYDRRHSRSSSRSPSRRTSNGGGFLSRLGGNRNEHDPAVLEARERVHDAERAEREADRALEEARLSVREAREHVKRLEVEAKEDSRRAKVKQTQAKEMSKMGRSLGRSVADTGYWCFAIGTANNFCGHAAVFDRELDRQKTISGALVRYKGKVQAETYRMPVDTTVPKRGGGCQPIVSTNSGVFVLHELFVDNGLVLIFESPHRFLYSLLPLLTFTEFRTQAQRIIQKFLSTPEKFVSNSCIRQIFTTIRLGIDKNTQPPEAQDPGK